MNKLNWFLTLIHEDALAGYYVDNPETGLWVKDLDGRYLSCNHFVSERLMGLANPNDVMGMTDFDLPWKNAAPTIRGNDQRVADDNKSYVFFENDIILADGRVLSFVCQKRPIYDHDQIVGTVGLSFTLPKEGIVMEHRDKFLEIVNAGFTGRFDKFKLSRRQLQCLQCLIRGMTVKQIALEIGLAPKTVEHYLTTLKEKLNCKTRQELIEKAHEMGMVGYF